MAVTTKIIKGEFIKAEDALEFCWKVLADMKESNIREGDFIHRMLNFQGRLATVIFELQSIRDKIILEQKSYVRNKNNYDFNWFKSRMKLLTSFKEGIDHIVHLAKTLGDAFVNFFYQWDTDLLNDHLNHQKIMNHTAGLGERGELEFIKNFKNIDHKLTIFHGITNVLRYGDFSFYDLKEKRIVEIGELKTKKIDDFKVGFSLTLINKKKVQEFQPEKEIAEEIPKDKRERQIRGITKFLAQKDETSNVDKEMVNQSYCKEIEKLIDSCPVGGMKIRKVSPGLNFTCIKFKRASLFFNLFLRDKTKIMEGEHNNIRDNALLLMKEGSNHNSIFIGGPMSDSYDEDHSIPGTIPLFWMPMHIDLLKKIYFGQVHIISTLNPVHLIEQVGQLGFIVESKYAEKFIPKLEGERVNVLQGFDLFLPYITSHLLTEEFVIDSVKLIRETEFWGEQMKISIRPQQRIQLPNKKT